MGPNGSREIGEDDGLQINPRTTSNQVTESEYSVEEQAKLTGDGGADETSPEDDVSLCDYHDIPPPPDGGYGWVVVFASFMCNMIVDGIAYTFGKFHQPFALHFNESQATTAWVGSLLSGVYLSAGPIVSALTNKYGCRNVCIAGSCIGAIAFVLSIFSKSINMLILTYGVLGGIGFGLIYLPAVVCVGYYFETKRSLATGIAVCGSGFGTVFFPSLAEILLTEYKWQGANLILAGLILNCVVFGALMRPLEYAKPSSVKPLLQRMAEEKRFQMERGSIGGSYFMVQLPDGSMEKRMKMPINIDPGVHSSFNLDQLVPVPTVPTLPTISEVKVQEHSSSGATSNSGSMDLKSSSTKSKSKKAIDDTKEQTKDVLDNKPADEFNKTVIPRNASQPAFTTHVQGLPKNGSVPFFDRIRKTSTGERYKPSLSAIKNSRSTLNSNGDIRKSLHLRLSVSSMLGSRNNNTELDDGESITFTTSKLSLRQAMPKEKPMIVRPLSRKDIFYSGSVVNLPEYQSQKSLTNYRQSVISLSKSMRGDVRDGDFEKGPQQPLCPCLVLPNSFKEALGTMLDMTLLKNPVFLMIGISNVFGMAATYIPFVYLPRAAENDGIDKNLATFLLSVIGITNIVGRIACGYIADFPQVNSLLLNNICLIVCSFSLAATPLCYSYGGYVAASVFFGLAISGYISLTSIILVDLLGLDKLTNAFGLLILFRGAAAMIGPPIAGAINDATGSYSVTFYMAGFLFLLSTITSFMAPMMKTCIAPQTQPLVLDQLTPIDEDIEEENEDDIPEIVETAPSPVDPPEKEIKQIESVL
ncbi:monocarboxylate transporter 3 isoform X3 [Leptopilina heterotoma]|uniref:monocarboxylate transporter 3 isoform X3 n=1 Tax=Leptopilina heterotoma TaxID=63436 RepID=UPI001CA9B9AF|nr:monocarboxylate transporter 3 isoform X3 [Leptopilina heterotoma]